MSCLAVIDTNVLISSLLSKHSNSATVLIVNKIFSREIIPVFSGEILKEYNEVLRRKKFKFSSDLVESFIRVIEDSGIKIEPKQSNEILIDMKDLPFYEVVLEKKDKGAYLVTGNIKHFPNKPFIVTANELLAILENNN